MGAGRGGGGRGIPLEKDEISFPGQLMIRDKSLETGYLAKYKVIMETDFQFYNCIMIVRK